MEPVIHFRNYETNTWWKQDSNTGSLTNTGRPIERGHSSVVGAYGNNQGGGIVNQGIVLINTVDEIQKNLNAFAILAENKRVDIAIADNKVKNYINILPNV